MLNVEGDYLILPSTFNLYPYSWSSSYSPSLAPLLLFTLLLLSNPLPLCLPYSFPPFNPLLPLTPLAGLTSGKHSWVGCPNSRPLTNILPSGGRSSGRCHVSLRQCTDSQRRDGYSQPPFIKDFRVSHCLYRNSIVCPFSN